MSNFSRNRGSGFYLNIVLCCLAVVLLVGILSNISSPGDDFTAGTEGTDATQGYSIKYHLTGVRILNDKVPSSVEAGETVILVFAPLEGYEFHLQAQNVVVKNASYTYSEESNGYHILTLKNIVGNVEVHILAQVVVPDPGDGFYPVMMDNHSCYEFVNVPEMMYPGKEYRIEARHLTDVDRSIPFYDSDSGYKIRAEQGNNVTYFYISDITANQEDYCIYIDTMNHTHFVDVTTNLIGCTMSSDAFEYLHPGAVDLIYLTAEPGYVLPATVSVTGGASVKSWNSKTGELVVLRTSLDDVTIECIAVAASVPEPDPIPDPVAYNITWELIGCSTNDPDTPVPGVGSAGQSYQLILDLGYVAFPDVSQISVFGAQWEWDSDECILELWDATGPVTVTISCIPESYSFSLKLDGNYLESPSGRNFTVTSDGELELRINRKADNVCFGTVQQPVNCKFEIVDESSPDYLIIRVYDFTGDASLVIGSVAWYDTNHELTNCTLDEDFSWLVSSSGAYYFVYEADSGCVLPDNVSIEGDCSSEWLPAVGSLKIWNVRSDLTITVDAVEGEPDEPPVNSYHISVTATKSLTPAAATNATSISEGEEVVLVYSKANEYVHFGSIKVTNAEASWKEENGCMVITIWNPTDTVYVTVGNYVEYPVTYNLTNCFVDDEAPSAVRVGKEYAIYFQTDDGYELSHDVHVTGVYSAVWDVDDPNKLILSAPYGPVTITLECEAEPELVPYALTLKVNDAECFTSLDIPEYVYAGMENVIVLESNLGSVGGWYLPDAENCTLSYQIVDNVTYFYIRNVIGPVNIEFAEHYHDISVNFNLLGCEVVMGDDSFQYWHIFEPYELSSLEGWVLPDGISVEGAEEYTWDPATGDLTIDGFTASTVTVTVYCDERVGRE